MRFIQDQLRTGHPPGEAWRPCSGYGLLGALLLTASWLAEYWSAQPSTFVLIYGWSVWGRRCSRATRACSARHACRRGRQQAVLVNAGWKPLRRVPSSATLLAAAVRAEMAACAACAASRSSTWPHWPLASIVE